MLHQEAVIVQELSLAERALRIFSKFLKSHLELEDQLLLPAHETITAEKSWRTLIYQEEHKKLLSLLSNMREMMSKPPEPHDMRRWVIEFIDYERTFKNVMEHHEEREEKGLLMELDNHLDTDDLHSLITQCHLAWQESYDSMREDIEDIRSQLP